MSNSSGSEFRVRGFNSYFSIVRYRRRVLSISLHEDHIIVRASCSIFVIGISPTIRLTSPLLFCSDVQATLYTPTVPKHTYTDPLARTRLPSIALATQAHTRRSQTGPHNTKPRLPHSDRGTDLTRRVTGKQQGNGQVSVPRLPSVLSSFTGESSRRLFSYFLSL